MNKSNIRVMMEVMALPLSRRTVCSVLLLLLTAACIHVPVGVKRTAEVGAKCENKALSYLKGRYRDHNRQHRVNEMDCLLCFLYLGITVPQK